MKFFKCRHKKIRFTVKPGILWYCTKCGYEEPITEKMVKYTLAAEERLEPLVQEEVEKYGCKHCTGVILGFFEYEEGYSLTITDIGANYCPMCGRKLI